MIKTIVALFAVYQSSFGQGPANVQPFVPIAPVAVGQPAPVAPTVIVDPAAPLPPVQQPPVQVQPVQPIQPPVQVQPVQPIQPPLPVQPAPVQPAPLPPPVIAPIQPLPPVQPINPWAPAAVQPGGGFMPWMTGGSPVINHKLECKLTPTRIPNPAAIPPVTADPRSCAFQTQTITNPRDTFEVLASKPGSMYEAVVNIELTPTGLPIDRLKGFWCTAEGSCMNSIINVKNTRGVNLEIDEIKCDKHNSCAGTQFNFGPGVYIDYGHVYCSHAVPACDGCTIKYDAQPAQPCTLWVEPI